MKRLLAESVSEALNIEGRLFTTLRYLLLRPGLLTSEYSAGRRVRYVAPARLYLLTSVVFGAALVFADNTFVVNMDGPGEEDRVVWMRMWLWSVLGMLPVFALMLKVAAWNRSKYLTEHLVFAMHVHAFGFVLVGVGLAIAEANIFVPLTAAVVLAVPALLLGYLVLALRRYYDMSPLRATLASLLLSGAYLAAQLAALLGTGFVAARMAAGTG